MRSAFTHLGDRAVLVTEGRSLLAPALVETFGSAGARVYSAFPDGASAPASAGTPLYADLRREAGYRALLEAASSHARVEVVVVPLALEGAVEVAADEAFQPIVALKAALSASEAPPRYLIPIIYTADEVGSRVGRAVCRTLVRYAAGHLAARDVRVNLVRAEGRRGPELAARTSRAALALASGWLDAVRGQELVIGDR